MDWLDLEELFAKDFPKLGEDANFIINCSLNASRFFLVNSLHSIDCIKKGVEDFVYWKRYNAITFNVFGTGSSHQLMMSTLYTLELLNKSPRMKEWDDAVKDTYKRFGTHQASSESADCFITENYGFFMSSASGYGRKPITIGEDYIMSATEKAIFKDFTLRHI